MKARTVYFMLFVCFCKVDINALSFPGPRVYVVTPSTRSAQKDEDKKIPFYYHKWMRRMDTEQNATTTTTLAPVKTPDLIFAEFESDGSMQKSIRKLLEKEKITKATTMSPIYVPDSEENKVTRVVNYGLPVKVNSHDEEIPGISSAKPSYSYTFGNNYDNNIQAPVYLPSTTQSTTKATTTTTTTDTPISIENIWHIIDDEKYNQYSGKWQEVTPKDTSASTNHQNNEKNNEDVELKQSHLENEENKEQKDEVMIDENFALPGFATNPGSGAENESRAIRTEPNIRFPYVNLKPFQMKSSKKPSYNTLSNSKKNSNLLTTLDNFSDLKYPVRGEAQDVVSMGSPIDRYNPAQPYLPQQKYGDKLSKQSSPIFSPQKATANLVPPPPPPSKGNGDFPSPASYDSFPPYAPPGPSFSPVAPPPVPTPSDSNDSPVLDTSDDSYISDSSDDDDKPTMDLGYRYKPPSDTDADNSPMINMGYQYKPPAPSIPQFLPTPSPTPKPFPGYSYNKPGVTADISPMIDSGKPEIQGYHYSKPKPIDHMPQSFDFPTSYGHEELPPHGHHSDYPELIFQKPHNDIKGGDNVKEDDMGMMPPSPPSDTKPDMYGPLANDHGFPIDFPTDFKYHHDFDEHDHDHDHDHYHYHPTTTSTTETPRVNRFSYYYLGKKLYYLPLYFSVYFIVYVGALIIKAILRHKIVYPNSWRPNTTTATFFSKRSVDEFMSNENLHEVTRKVTRALATAAEKYMSGNNIAK